MFHRGYLERVAVLSPAENPLPLAVVRQGELAQTIVDRGVSHRHRGQWIEGFVEIPILAVIVILVGVATATASATTVSAACAFSSF